MNKKQQESAIRISEMSYKLTKYIGEYCDSKDYQVYTEEIVMVLSKMIECYSRAQLRDQLK